MEGYRQVMLRTVSYSPVFFLLQYFTVLVGPTACTATPARVQLEYVPFSFVEVLPARAAEIDNL